MEGRARNSADPERIGVGLSVPTGRKEDGGLSAQRRHSAGQVKAYEERGVRKEIGGDEDRTYLDP